MTGCILSSCKKSETAAPTPLTKTQLISAKSWKLTAVTVKKNNDAPVDEFLDYDACEKDDLYTYRANNTYEANEGATKCNPSANQIRATGTWAFTTNETKLSTTVGTFVNIYDLVELTATTLKVRETSVDGATYISDYTYTAQ